MGEYDGRDGAPPPQQEELRCRERVTSLISGRTITAALWLSENKRSVETGIVWCWNGSWLHTLFVCGVIEVSQSGKSRGLRVVLCKWRAVLPHRWLSLRSRTRRLPRCLAFRTPFRRENPPLNW